MNTKQINAAATARLILERMPDVFTSHEFNKAYHELIRPAHPTPNYRIAQLRWELEKANLIKWRAGHRSKTWDKVPTRGNRVAFSLFR